MAAMVNQTLSQMLQAAPTSATGLGARSADGTTASDTSFSNTLERKMSEPDRTREAATQSSQNTRQSQENQPVKDKAPEPKSAERKDSADSAQRTESSDSSGKAKETKPTDQDSAEQDTSDDSTVADAATAAAEAATATPESLAATPAVLAATPANDAAIKATADAQAAAAIDKTQKAADVVASAMDASKSARPELAAKGGNDKADLSAADTRTATDTPQNGKAASLRDTGVNFAAQLDSRLAGNGKPTDSIQLNAGSTGSTNGINPALATNLPTQAAAAASRPVLPSHLATPVDSADWADAVGNRVVWMSGRDESRAELILTPPHLGKLEISLTVSGDTTTAHFTAATPAAREALEQAMPRLREMLEQAGMTLADSNVNTAPQDQSGESGNGRRFSGGRQTAGGEMMIENVGTSAGRWIARGEGMIDTFA